MKVYLGADHRGFRLKEELKGKLINARYTVEDVGNKLLDPSDDYVDFAKNVAEKVSNNPGSMGILLCGSGAGVDMVANKVLGIRSALVFDQKRSVQAREHEDANVLSLPADVLDGKSAWEVVETFLITPFSGEERHRRRLEKLGKIDQGLW